MILTLKEGTYDPNNPIMAKYGRRLLAVNASLRPMVDYPPQAMMEMYRYTANILRYLPTHDPAFERFYNDEKRIRDLMFFQHMRQEGEKSLCLSISDRYHVTDIIEVCDTYKLGYMHWQHYHEVGKAGQWIHGVVVDLRGKDLNDPEILEAHEFIREACGLNREFRSVHSISNARISLDYAPCFFQEAITPTETNKEIA